MGWHLSIILAPGRWRQETQEVHKTLSERERKRVWGKEGERLRERRLLKYTV